ncbi:peptidylprolyl isomerase [Kaarinaea lacus]
MLKQLIKEPLFHFLFIGAVLFVLFGIVGESDTGPNNRIEVTQADVDRLVATWQRRWNRPPTINELNNMVESYIREEILYREAVAMGLEKDDSVVRRRMAQKIEFLFKDISTPTEPTDADLQAYLEKHPEKFTTPARYDFSHVYLSVDKRGNQAMADAQQLLAKLQKESNQSDPTQFSDLFMFDYHFADITDFEITRIFGEQFTKALADIKTGQWQGPVDSGYGIHLVKVEKRTEPSLPPVAEIRDKVKTEYIAELQRDANQKFYQSLRERYEIVVESSDTEKSVAMGNGSEDKKAVVQ